jgi:N-alpha-acetyltransferase 30
MEMEDSLGKQSQEGAIQELPTELRYLQYSHSLERQYLPSIRALMKKELSEPYSIYVYRYFLYQWEDLCFMVRLPSLSLQVTTKRTRRH